jgi:hypothetical protein
VTILEAILLMIHGVLKGSRNIVSIFYVHLVHSKIKLLILVLLLN